jgi:hypothetical protein
VEDDPALESPASRLASQFIVLDQRLVFARNHHLLGLFFETNGPVVRVGHMPAPRIGVKIVNQITAAHDQNAFVPKRRELPADFETEGSRLRLIDAELDDWNVAFGYTRQSTAQVP